jgi:hypothetical protein
VLLLVDGERKLRTVRILAAEKAISAFDTILAQLLRDGLVQELKESEEGAIRLDTLDATQAEASKVTLDFVVSQPPQDNPLPANDAPDSPLPVDVAVPVFADDVGQAEIAELREQVEHAFCSVLPAPLRPRIEQALHPAPARAVVASMQPRRAPQLSHALRAEIERRLLAELDEKIKQTFERELSDRLSLEMAMPDSEAVIQLSIETIREARAA